MQTLCMTDRMIGNCLMFKLHKFGVNEIGFDDFDTIVFIKFCNKDIFIRAYAIRIGVSTDECSLVRPFI